MPSISGNELLVLKIIDCLDVGKTQKYRWYLIGEYGSLYVPVSTYQYQYAAIIADQGTISTDTYFWVFPTYLFKF